MGGQDVRLVDSGDLRAEVVERGLVPSYACKHN